LASFNEEGVPVNPLKLIHNKKTDVCPYETELGAKILDVLHGHNELADKNSAANVVKN
jgi:hypothetical protein